MSDTRTTARPIVVAAVTASAIVLLVSLYVDSWWVLVAGIAAVVANIAIGIKFEDSLKPASAGAILAAVACAIPSFLA